MNPQIHLTISNKDSAFPLFNPFRDAAGAALALEGIVLAQHDVAQQRFTATSLAQKDNSPVNCCWLQESGRCRRCKKRCLPELQTLVWSQSGSVHDWQLSVVVFTETCQSKLLWLLWLHLPSSSADSRHHGRRGSTQEGSACGDRRSRPGRNMQSQGQNWQSLTSRLVHHRHHPDASWEVMASLWMALTKVRVEGPGSEWNLRPNSFKHPPPQKAAMAMPNIWAASSQPIRIHGPRLSPCMARDMATRNAWAECLEILSKSSAGDKCPSSHQLCANLKLHHCTFCKCLVCFKPFMYETFKYLRLMCKGIKKQWLCRAPQRPCQQEDPPPASAGPPRRWPSRTIIEQ